MTELEYLPRLFVLAFMVTENKSDDTGRRIVLVMSISKSALHRLKYLGKEENLFGTTFYFLTNRSLIFVYRMVALRYGSIQVKVLLQRLRSSASKPEADW